MEFIMMMKTKYGLLNKNKENKEKNKENNLLLSLIINYEHASNGGQFRHR